MMIIEILLTIKNISDEFAAIIENLSHSKLKEVRYMWEDFQNDSGNKR